ncbi:MULTISPECIES: nitrite reductase small subunit NirD [unclassified Paenibacillus]|uniref:nitrite reductase small subunit NirD n=1 Tax=unclassified Paenibacillus TaxID=185978 RepID=UPI002404DCB2|nr:MULTISPECIES: nitrite reductase small subunit NirD [unclassified Paenibacillus]MDF9840537.1 nitrite reductase (NADH) small subunit [Paenibacillus sp. PastF-2]MDF9847119.1 nitrite reductase (NADH) small subunit [Paenibacillus sp. PastM-2]MDF9853691.1 nitrite reductase (NADH) small subunit [Paenibacillus sp. PastF-1]MDH6478823.1 nitrite reductase (NADH) small subunit [Paenibacillus sp. PastH-2]MDH6506555.1 nitrite reductase (NADH) small subunit [Paenibacillus sp. PastM-3]
MENTNHEYTIGTVQHFLPQIGRVIGCGPVELAVFKTSDGQIFAVENKNPHPKGGPLAEGIVSGHYLYDPLYDWKIDLRSGEVQAPDNGRVAIFPVTVDGDSVKVTLQGTLIQS